MKTNRQLMLVLGMCFLLPHASKMISFGQDEKVGKFEIRRFSVMVCSRLVPKFLKYLLYIEPAAEGCRFSAFP